MKKYKVSYEVIKEIILEAKNKEEAIELAEKGVYINGADIFWEEGEITSGIEAIELKD